MYVNYTKSSEHEYKHQTFISSHTHTHTFVFGHIKSNNKQKSSTK